MIGVGVRIGLQRKLDSVVPYDPDAQIYFDSIGDVPTYAKVAISNRVVAAKANGTYPFTYWQPLPPTTSMLDGHREFVSDSVVGTQVYSASNPVNPSPLYNFPRALACLNGFSYWGAGAYLMGIDADSLSASDMCTFISYPDSDANNIGYNFGAFGGSTSAFLFQKNDASGNVTGFALTNNTGTGKMVYAGDGSDRRFFINKATDSTLWGNGVLKKTIAGSAGSFPPLELLHNGGKTSANNFGGSNEVMGTICVYANSLTPTKIATEDADWATFLSAMKRTGTYDFSVIQDGNSHTVYWNSSMFRNINYNLAGLAEVNAVQMGISGQDLDAMIARLATDIYPKIVAGKGKYYMFVYEGTNQIGGGSTAAQTIALMETYCAGIKSNASGKGVTIEIITATLYNRKFTGNDNLILESDDYNVLLLAGGVGSVDHVIQLADPYTTYRSDYGSDAAFISAVRSFTVAPLYHDDTHLSNIDTGYPFLSGLISDYIKTQEGL